MLDSTCYFENFILVNAYSSNIKPVDIRVSGILANVYLIAKMIALQFKNIHYLTPLRVYPQRQYILDRETDDIGISGEFTLILCKNIKANILTDFYRQLMIK